MQYEVFFDDISQGVVTLINGASNLSASGTVLINIPGGTTNARITVGVKQNGDDYGALDNFRVYE